MRNRFCEIDCSNNPERATTLKRQNLGWSATKVGFKNLKALISHLLTSFKKYCDNEISHSFSPSLTKSAKSKAEAAASKLTKKKGYFKRPWDESTIQTSTLPTPYGSYSSYSISIRGLDSEHHPWGHRARWLWIYSLITSHECARSS